MLNSTKLENESAVFIPSILIMPVPLMSVVTKKQPVGGGQCSKRDWTARLISTAAGTTTSEALEIWTVNFGSDWTRFTGWQKNEADFELTLKKSTGRRHMPSTTSLVSLARETNTGWVLEHILVLILTVTITMIKKVIEIKTKHAWRWNQALSYF